MAVAALAGGEGFANGFDDVAGDVGCVGVIGGAARHVSGVTNNVSMT